MRKLTIVFHDGGGGHRSAADALKTILSTQERPWEVSLLNLQELLDSLDLFRTVTGVRTQDIYNRVLRKGWTRLTPQMLKVLQRVIRLYHLRLVKALQTYWMQHPTDLVLSVIPHFNRVLAESIKSVGSETPFVTLITDLADYPPHFWIELESEYIIVGTERAKQQALMMGHRAHRIFEASGMVLKPRFYEQATVDRAAERKKLGLDTNLPTGIVLFGGYGSQVMVDIARKLDRSDSQVQLILLCGHNEKLAAKLKSLKTKRPILVVGFTPNVEYYMALSDFFIGKPGPGSISEALQFHLPVIVECNVKTLPQERYNAEWVTEKGFGVVVTSVREIASSVKRLLQSSTFDELRRNVGAYSNRALFEIPKFLDQCQKAETNLL
ncbi:MAG TPA: glycosyltransferase [Candidatus Dormibacteraeota bacterium]|nr:glycosyltransferase [Candidatus Dormibacteraeota bacterium]